MKKFNFLGNLLRKKFVMSGMSGMNGLRADAVNPDSQPTVNRQSRLTSEQRHYSVTSARVAREWLNASAHLRVWTLKLVSVLVLVLTIGIGNAWGADASITSFTATSGNIVSGVITYSSTKVSTNGPEVVSSQLKLYRKGKSGGLGDYVTVTAVSPAKITSITFTLSSSLGYSYQVDAASAVTGTNSSIAITSINASSVKFQNNSSSQMFVTGISVTYSTGASCTSSPTVSAGSNSSVTATTARVSCSSGISSLGSAGCSISSYGFVIGGSANPSIGGSGVTQHQVGTTYTTTGTSFYKDLTGLSPETTYYVRPYATNGNGTAYGTQTYFTTEAKGCTDKGASSITSGASSDADHGPIHAFYDYSTSQFLYTKSDLDLAAGKKGTIKSIYFEYSGAAAMAARTIKIYMANTALTSLTTSSYVLSASFGDPVYDGTFSCSSAGWYEITLDTPFDYNGIGNLAVMVDDNTNAYESSKYFKYHSATGAQIYKRQDDTDIDPASWTPASAIDYRPNTKFCIEVKDMVASTVTLMDNSAKLKEESAGAGVTLPSRSGCTEYKFVGWTKSWVAEQDEWTTTAPTIIPAGSYTPSGDENLYPVYIKEEVTGTTDVTVVPGTFTDKGTNNYGSGAERTGTVSTINFGAHYVTGNQANSPVNPCSAGTYLQCKASDANIYNKTAMPGKITKVVVNQYAAQNIDLYCGDEQLMASDETGTGQTPSGTLQTAQTAATAMTWNVSGSYTYFDLKKGSGSSYITSIVITYASLQTSYISVPSCCATNITLSDPSITDASSSGSTITFDKTSPVGTCGSDKTVTATVTLTAGYQMTALSFSGGSVSVSPEISTPITSTTNYMLTFTQGTDATLTTTATVSAKPLTSISLAEASINVYVGEIKYVDVAFAPADFILSKAWSQAATPKFCQLDSYDSYNKLKITGGRVGVTILGDSTETASIKYDADNTKTASISVTVKPLPTVTFVDLIHNKTDFANAGDGWTAGTGVLSSTATSGTVSHAKKTPTHTDVSEPGTGNTCEKGHLHLAGWIRSDYSKVAAYMDGTGDVPTKDDLTGAGEGYWFNPGANINVETYNGKTFYAVWAGE